MHVHASTKLGHGPRGKQVRGDTAGRSNNSIVFRKNPRTERLGSTSAGGGVGICAGGQAWPSMRRWAIAGWRGLALRRVVRSAGGSAIVWLVGTHRPLARGNFHVIDVEVVVSRNVSGQLRAFDLFVVFVDDARLNHLATERVDGVSNVGVEFSSAVGILNKAAFFEPLTALIAVIGAKMVLHSALAAVRSELPAGHGDEGTACAVDNFQVANHETIIEGNRAERFQPLAGFFH